jgi:hypothetical protein
LGSCVLQGVVYKIICQCGQFYIGETGRPLHERITEHVRAFKNPEAKSYANYPLARHRKGINHGNDEGIPGIYVKILGREPKAIARRILEATFIRSEKPSINGKEEMEGIQLLID